MNGVQFREIMRGPYVGGIGYVGWSEEHAAPYVEDFANVLPKVSNPVLKRNKKSYTITWEEGDSAFKSVMVVEEDAFSGPVYHHGSIIVLSNDVSVKAKAKAAEKKKPAEKKGKKDAKKAAQKAPPKAAAKETWKTVDNTEELLQTHILPLFYYLCLTNPPKNVVFL